MEKDGTLKANPEYFYVDTTEGLSRLTEALRGATRVGLDTEADSLHHYFEKVCLIQLSFSHVNYIVDPLSGCSLTEFLEVLSQKELILHGADYDLRMLKKSLEFRPKAAIFDTMLAAQVLGYEHIGLAALVEKLCGILLSKSGQKSDWSIRPLSSKQLSYATCDTKYLETIADEMTKNLRELNRTDWHRECCERVRETSGLTGKRDVDEPWRIKGSSKLPPKVLAFVRELWKWRDETARKKDRPPFMILRNEDLIELAEWRAAHPEEPLPSGPSFLKRITGDNLVRLENAVRSAESLLEEEWPVILKRTRPEVVDRYSQEKVEALIEACRAIASTLKIESCFLAPRASLTAVVRHRSNSIESVQSVSALMRWQAELVMPAIKTVLNM
jgi:ribonuclease D